ncbi:MAG: RimK family alpha-L-glutamate ligase, partial [Bacteroidetes bacterium]
VIDPQDFDVLIPRFGRKMKYASKIVEHFSKNMGVYSTGSSEGIAISFDKMLTAQKLEQAGIRVPHTILVKKPKEVDFLLEKIGGLPCLMKIVTGGLGKGVQILETYSAAKSNMETIAYRFKSSILLQKLIVQDSKTITDMRLWVVGGKVIATTVRSHNDGDFQSDFAFSQTERNIKITAEERKMAIKVAKILKLDICGVDIMRDKDGVPYVLEVSANPSLSGITSESEVDISSKILDFIEKKVAKIKK